MIAFFICGTMSASFTMTLSPMMMSHFCVALSVDALSAMYSTVGLSSHSNVSGTARRSSGTTCTGEPLSSSTVMFAFD